VLVFTRRRDDAIVIGDGIEIRVLRIGKDGVRIGVTAPPEVAVHRREIYEQVRAANASAAASDAQPVHGMAERLRRRAIRPAAK
jgi:carbon storage regulator